MTQREVADLWKENMIKDLKREVLEFEIIGEFLEEIKKEFGGEDKESKKVVELKKLEQE